MSHMVGQETTRFAPSPTGFLHLGHVFAARFARDKGHVFRLRLEDIDPDRCRPEYAQAALDDLSWLGLHWDGAVMVQSAQLDLYRAALDMLARRSLSYPCFCSRADVRREIALAAGAPQGPDGAPVYPGTCRALTQRQRAGRLATCAPHAWRLDMAAALAASPPLLFVDGTRSETAQPAGFGDVVLGRRDAHASYHLCVTHDDAAQGVTLVTRGEDLRAATHVQVLLQHLFGWPTPRYLHHPLLRDANGGRLSKRDGAVSVRALRARGLAPGEVVRMAELQAAQE